QDRRPRRLCHPQRSREPSMNRWYFLLVLSGAGIVALLLSVALGVPQRRPGFRLLDVTSAAAIQFRHNSGAYGGKLLPETLGSGCAFLDYDRDGWQDILLVNAMDWPDHKRERSTLRLYRNLRNGTFADVTLAAHV